MYILFKPLAILGTVMVATSALFCPFLRIPLVGNWNLYQTDIRLFLITYVMLVLCVFLFFFRKIRAYRIATFILGGWSVLAFIAVYFTINNYFGLKLIDGMISKAITLKWGWLVFFLGILLMFFSTRNVKLKPAKESQKGILT